MRVRAYLIQLNFTDKSAFIGFDSKKQLCFLKAKNTVGEIPTATSFSLKMEGILTMMGLNKTTQHKENKHFNCMHLAKNRGMI